MHQSVAQAVHCINPDCPRPYPQAWGNRFCNGCGAVLILNDRYIPLQRLGTGGFAAIYTVWDVQKKTERVLKVLVETAPKALQLFEQEAAVLERLKHPGVPRVERGSYFVVRVGNPPTRLLPCLVMEKINGRTLLDVLDDYPQGCPEAWVRDWLYQAVDILRELHRCGIIHRDLKPSNLMLRAGTGQLVAIDFGGAKQLGSMPIGSRGVSTKLVSPGYSPPEQIMGEAVGPAADFYALGRTMIQLLTGQEIGDVEDPVTGELRWRNWAAVTPVLAELLDDMVRLDPQQRPATADEIRWRLDRTSPIARTPRPGSAFSFPSGLATAVDALIEVTENAIAALGGGVTSIVRFVFRAVTHIVLACLDTTLEMVLGGLGAATGAAIGFFLIHWTIIGDRFAAWIKRALDLLLPTLEITASPKTIIIFALAGWLTGSGLTLAGGFGQQRRPIVAGVTGILGYSVAWLIWQSSSFTLPALGFVSAIAVVPLVLGLGLPSHYLVHAVVTAVGMGTVFGGLASLNVWSNDIFVNVFFKSADNLNAFIKAIAFFGLWGVVLGFWLGVSYYLLVPVLRWLGWR